MINTIINKIIRSPSKYLIKASSEEANFKKSYSQCGEDMIIDYIFRLRGISMPTYLDIGSYHPWILSNTGYFYQRGCRGINIDANPENIKRFMKQRPGDINLNVGVGDTNGEANFYIMKDRTLSTLSKNEVDAMEKLGKKLERIETIKIRTLQSILYEYSNNIFPDFLSIDVEGYELDILKTIDFQVNSPKIICVEIAEYSPIGAGKKKMELFNYLIGQGYYEYACTNLNSILVKNEFWYT
jgi:FkbM family methyltransferase